MKRVASRSASDGDAKMAQADAAPGPSRPSRQQIRAKRLRISSAMLLPGQVAAFLARRSSQKDYSPVENALPQHIENDLAVNFASMGIQEDVNIKGLKGLQRNPKAIERQEGLAKLFKEHVTNPLNHLRNMLPQLEATYAILNSNETDAKKLRARLNKVGVNARFIKEVMALDEEAYVAMDATVARIWERVNEVYEAEVRLLRAKRSESITQRLKHLDQAQTTRSPRKEEEYVYYMAYYEQRTEDIDNLLDTILRAQKAFEDTVHKTLNGPTANKPAGRATRNTVAGQETMYTLLATADVVIGELKDKFKAMQTTLTKEPNDPLADLFKGLNF